MPLTIKIESFGAISRFLPDELSLVHAENCLVSDILTEVLRLYPTAEKLLAYCACAIGEDIVSRNMALEQDATLVLLSPVAGG